MKCVIIFSILVDIANIFSLTIAISVSCYHKQYQCDDSNNEIDNQIMECTAKTELFTERKM